MEDRVINNDNDLKKRSKGDGFSLDFNVVFPTRKVHTESLVLFPRYQHEDCYHELPKLRRFYGTGNLFVHLFSFVNALHSWGIPKDDYAMVFDRSLEGQLWTGTILWISWIELTRNILVTLFVDWAPEYKHIDIKKLKLVTWKQSTLEIILFELLFRYTHAYIDTKYE